MSKIQEYGTTGQIGNGVKLDYDNGNTTSFQYPGLDKAYASSDDMWYYYDFDNCGRPLTVRDKEGTASSYRYYTDGNINNHLKEEGTMRRSVHNYVGNPGFDGGSSMDDDRWVASGVGTASSYSVDRVSDTGYEGNTSIRVAMTGSTQGRAAAAQTISSLKKGTYTLSAYLKTAGVTAHEGREDYGATIGVDFLNGTSAGTTVISGEVLQGDTDTAIDNGWRRISVTFEVLENSTNVQIWGGLNYASGRVWLDCFQLEAGEVFEGYNYVNNPGFEYTQWGGVTLNVWSRENMGEGDGRNANSERQGSYAARITGDPDQNRWITQTINVTGKEGDVFNLSGWAKANAIPGKTFRIAARIHYSDGSTAVRSFDFDPYLPGWQYAGGMFSTDDQKSSTNLTYTKLEVFVEYSDQCNTAWFDAIQLTKDEGATYVYDDEGNLTSVKAATEQDRFQSDEEGNLTNLVSPTGSSYTYAYDEEQNLTWARGTDGVSYHFTYDTYGNPLTATASGNGAGNSQGIQTGIPYHIINKKSGLALDASGSENDAVWTLQQEHLDAGEHQKWILRTDGDGYVLESATKTGWNFTVKDGGTGDGTSVVLAAAASDTANQRFSLSAASGGGYRILTANTSYAKALTNGGKTEKAGITIEASDSSKGYQEWYLEPVDGSVLRMESSQTYTEGGRHVASVTDTRGNVTSYAYGSEYNGRLLTGITDAAGGTTTYQYDSSSDRLTNVSRTGTDASVGYTYEKGQLKSISHNGFTYDFIYDVYGNTAEILIGDESVLFHEKGHLNGPLVGTYYRNGGSLAYEYDKYERVSGITYEDGASYHYKYDSLGNLIETEDTANDLQYRFRYDSLGRPTYLSTSHGQELRVIYDEKDRVEKNVSIVDGSALTTEYVYGDLAAGQIPDVVYGVKIDGTQLLSYSYDSLGRARAQTLDLPTDYEVGYSYAWGEDWNATALVRQLVEKGEGFLYAWNYEYDALGNITEVRLGTEEILHYGYDSLSQLVRVDDAREGKTHTYTYDAGGNITSHSIYPYTREQDPGTAETVIPYTYAETGWKDKLTGYNGESFTYDAIGNPLTWRGGMTLTWKHGRRLATLTKNGTTSTYSYDDEGYRIEKQVGDTVTTYYRNGDMLLTEITGEDRIDYLYDADGLLLGFKYNGSSYYYRKNLQGDILGILDSTGDEVVEYTYDAWGKPLGCTGSLAESIGQKNPFRYRGYYYDVETGLYYLNSRYYDPVVGRFLNADSAISGIGGNYFGYNLFHYCNNNPINYYDSTGKSGEAIVKAWTASMWWLTLVDGILPIGDILYWGITAVIGTTIIRNVTSSIEDIEVDYSEQERKDERTIVKPGQKPTEEDGYVEPKTGPQKGKTKDGKIGWKDNRGNIWVPQPTGSAGAHGGGHWDVQSPKGGYINVYPGGIIRGGKAPYPIIPIFP